MSAFSPGTFQGTNKGAHDMKQRKTRIGNNRGHQSKTKRNRIAMLRRHAQRRQRGSK